MSDLRALAEAATPGPWTASEDEEGYWHIHGAKGDGVETPVGPQYVALAGSVHDDADAAYIAAASPAVVLALLDVVEAAQASDAFMSYIWTSYDLMAGAMKKKDALRAALAHVSEVMGE